jgi:hypothetical protein
MVWLSACLSLKLSMPCAKEVAALEEGQLVSSMHLHTIS